MRLYLKVAGFQQMCNCLVPRQEGLSEYKTISCLMTHTSTTSWCKILQCTRTWSEANVRLSCAKTGGSVWLQDDKWDDQSLLTHMPTIRTRSPHMYLKWLLSSKFETGGFIWVQDEELNRHAHSKYKINVYTQTTSSLFLACRFKIKRSKESGC